MRRMDECPGDSSVSASPRGPPWRPRRPRFQLRPSNSLPPQPPFILCCLFVRRAPGHRKRRFPELSELETIWGSVLNISRGKRCVQAHHRAELCSRPLGGVCSAGQLQPFERGSGQFLTSEEFGVGFPSAARSANVGFQADKEGPQSRRCAGGAVAETKDVCAWGAGVSEGCICFFRQVPNKPLYGTAGQKQVEATGTAATAWAALLVHYSPRLQRL